MRSSHRGMRGASAACTRTTTAALLFWLVRREGAAVRPYFFFSRRSTAAEAGCMTPDRLYLVLLTVDSPLSRVPFPLYLYMVFVCFASYKPRMLRVK